MNENPSTPATRSAPAATPDTRAAYARPALDRLGRWSALTLQQSVIIGEEDPLGGL